MRSGSARPARWAAAARRSGLPRNRSASRKSNRSARDPARAALPESFPAAGRVWRRGRSRRAARACTGGSASGRSRRACPLDDPSGIHHRNTVGDLNRDPDVVGDEDHRHAEFALQLAQQQQDLDLHGGVERRGRLVGEQEFRLAGQRQRDHRALPHPAGHLVRIGVEPAPGRGDPHQFQHLERARHRVAHGSCLGGASRSRRSGRRWCRPGRTRASAPGRSSRRSRRETPTAPHHQARARRGRRPGSRRRDLRPLRRQDPQQRAQRDALARAGLAEEAEHFALASESRHRSPHRRSARR